MAPALIFHSAKTLENWDFDTPLKTGIGGSETSHVELAKRTGLLNRFPVLSFAPVPEEDQYVHQVVGKTHWFSSLDTLNVNKEIGSRAATWLVYRNPAFFEQDLPVHNVYWFMAQDVGYSNMTEAIAAKIDRYICLCPEHASYTQQMYPYLKGKIVLSSNGVRTDLIEEIERDFPISRNPKRIIYASCPERGLKLILENWFRIREAVPDAELVVAYGFNNLDTIAVDNYEKRVSAENLRAMLNQPGIIVTGRLNQIELYKQWFAAGVWFYPNCFEESSCITCMDAQACGAIPVCNNLWALKQNVLHGLKYPGRPQNDAFLRSVMIRDLIELLERPELQESIRGPMMVDARKEFNWDRMADQLARWHEADHAKRGSSKNDG